MIWLKAALFLKTTSQNHKENAFVSQVPQLVPLSCIEGVVKSYTNF